MEMPFPSTLSMAATDSKASSFPIADKNNYVVMLVEMKRALMQVFF